MDDKKKVLGDREPLIPGSAILLKYGEQNIGFNIKSFLGTGGTSLVYNAQKLSPNGTVAGTLKEFWPTMLGGSSYNFEELLAAQQVHREADGTLCLPQDLCNKQFERIRENVAVLRKMKDQNAGLRFFIPYMELYAGQDGVPYVFTPENSSGITLAAYAKEARNNPNLPAVLQILHTMYALACADAQLLQEGALLLDIKPDNVLMPYRATQTGLENHKLLQDACSLFDVESVLLQEQLKQNDLLLPFSAGFTAPELGGYIDGPQKSKIGPETDIFAMAASLFNCLTGKTAKCETKESYIEALNGSPFGSVISPQLAESLGALMEQALAYEPAQRRICDPREFAKDIFNLIQDEEQKIAQRSSERQKRLRDNLSDYLTNALFRWPVHEYGAAAEKDMRVLIAGDNPQMINQALRAVFSSCHVLEHQLHVRVAAPEADGIVSSWVQSIDHSDLWLLHNTEETKSDTYNWQDYIGEVSWENVDPDTNNIAELVKDFRAGTVFLLTADNEMKGRSMAGAVSTPEEGRRICLFLDSDSGPVLYTDKKDKLEIVPISPDIADDRFLQAAENVAFNAHLLYERSKNCFASMKEINTNFHSWYNHSASMDTALAVKCRLYSAGLAWHDDPERDGEAFANVLKNDPSLLGKLSWLEHRRWAASKLCAGVKALPEDEYDNFLLDGGANGSGTNCKIEVNGKNVLFHAYLVPSRLDEHRPADWSTPADWKRHLHDKIPPELDPLSRAGAVLTQMFAINAEIVKKDILSGTQPYANQLKREIYHVLAKLPEEQSIVLKAAYQKLEKSIMKLASSSSDERASTAAIYRLQKIDLQKVLKESVRYARFTADKAQTALNFLDKDLFCVCYDDVEPKGLDDVLIANLPFELGSKRLTVAKFLCDKDLRANLIPVKLFDTANLLCIALTKNDSTARKYIKIAENLADVIANIGADVEIELRLLTLDDDVTPPASKNVRIKCIPVESDIETALTRALEGAELVDLTGGQDRLCTLAAEIKDGESLPLVTQSDGVYTALRGHLPATLPIIQPYTVDELFRLSGAVRVGDGEKSALVNYTLIYNLYEQIQDQFGKKAFYSLCETFAEAYKKASCISVLPPSGDFKNHLKYSLDTDDMHILWPLLRALADDNFITGLKETPEKGLFVIEFDATENNAVFLNKLVMRHLNHSCPLVSWMRSGWGDRRYEAKGNPRSVFLKDDSSRLILKFLQDKGLLTIGKATSSYDIELSRIDPSIPVLFEKYGNALETKVFAMLQECQKFDDVQLNYEYKYGEETTNELDVVVSYRNRPVLISCKACKEVEMAFVDEIYTRAKALHAAALPVLVCSELMPGANPTIENRCKSMGVILVDGFALDCTADLICAAVDELAEED